MAIPIKTRIQHKHDIEANWLLATNFVPLAGELIIYDIDAEHSFERFKVGNGVDNVNTLPFVIDVEQAQADARAYTDDKIDNLFSEWDIMYVFDGGDADVSLAILDNTILE